MKQDRLLSIHNTLTPLQRCDVSTRTAHWAITVLISNKIFIDLMEAQKLLLHSHCCFLCMKITFITMFTREVLLSSDNYVAHRSSKLPLFSVIYTCVVPWHIRKLEIDTTKLLLSLVDTFFNNLINLFTLTFFCNRDILRVIFKFSQLGIIACHGSNVASLSLLKRRELLSL